MSNEIPIISTSLEAPGSTAAEQAQFQAVLDQALTAAERELLSIAGASGSLAQAATWNKARQVVEGFRPVPWFIWRISNFVFGTPGETRAVPPGLLTGMRRLFFAAASDPLLGGGTRVSDISGALRVLKPDVVAAVSVIHALCRRLATKHLGQLWRPLIDEALVKAQIGVAVGMHAAEFGSGRGMLAGFAGSLGFAILLAHGEEAQAQEAFEQLAQGATAQQVGLSVYGCDPVQVSAMTLSAAGCGRDCASGLVSHVSEEPSSQQAPGQLYWLAALSIISGISRNQPPAFDDESWDRLNLYPEALRAELVSLAQRTIRRGHSLQWIL
ncbi:MAG: hypothetical protein EBZ48_06555 [Proteobacteria bacterium]|nr:hypothetical protein [Pseudomonadota bacterium]